MDMKCEQPASGARPLRRHALDEPGDDVVSDAVAMWAERVPRRIGEDCSVRTRSCRKRTIDPEESRFRWAQSRRPTLR